MAESVAAASLKGEGTEGQSAPGAPVEVTVTRGDGTLTASWAAVTGATSYHITYSSDGAVSWTLAAYEHPDASITITGVDNDAT